MKTVVITGASTGIGYACVEASLAKGHRVIATARKTADLDKLAAIGAKPVHLELTDKNDVEKAAQEIIKASQGKIDALFNNAGYGVQVALEDASWECLEEQHRTNVIGPIHLTNQLLPALQSNSKLIFNGSVLGIVTLGFRGPYSMSKYALEAAVDAYQLELESLGVKVHMIQPGPIEANFRQRSVVALNNVLNGKKTRLDYRQHTARLENPGNTKGTLPASAVADIYIGIIEGSHKKPRYLVTRMAKTAAFLKRILHNRFYLAARKISPVKLND